MIEPTREQEAKVDYLAGIYDSVSARPTTERPTADDVGRADYAVTCWRQSPSGAKYAVHTLTVHPDGTESDRR